MKVHKSSGTKKRGVISGLVYFMILSIVYYFALQILFADTVEPIPVFLLLLIGGVIVIGVISMFMGFSMAKKSTNLKIISYCLITAIVMCLIFIFSV